MSNFKATTHKSVLLPFAMPYFMKAFITNNNIVGNESIGDECTLHRGDDLGKDRLHSICNGLSYNSINNITEADRSIITHFPRMCNFWNQRNKSVIEGRWVTLLIKDIKAR